MPSRPNAMATFDVREHLFWTNTKIMVRESAARTESSALWSELEWNVRCQKLLSRTTSDVMDLHMWLSKNGTNKGLLTQTLIDHSQLVPTISSAWVRATLSAGLPFWGCLAFPNHRWGGSGQTVWLPARTRSQETCPGTILFHWLVSAEAITRECLPPCRCPSREAGHTAVTAVSAWPLPMPPATSVSCPGRQGFPVLFTAAHGHEAQTLNTCEVDESRCIQTTWKNY